MAEKAQYEEHENELGMEMTRTQTKGGDSARLEQVRTVDIENYHGLTAKIIVTYLAVCFMIGGQMLNLVGAGAFASDIAAAVGGSTKKAWLASVIAIGQAVLGPPLSQAADYWGRKWLLVVPICLGFVGDIVISRGNDMNTIIVGSIIAAISFSNLPIQYSVLSEILPRRWRPEAQAGANIALAIGALFTLLAGSKLVADSLFGYRIFYYIAAALNGVSAVLVTLFYNPLPRPLQTSLTFKEKMARLDWIGYLLFGPGLVLFLVGLSWSQNPYEWPNSHIIAPFIIGCVMLIAFGIYEWKGRTDGMLHHDLFKTDRNFALSLVIIVVEGAVFFSANAFFVFEMSVIYDTDSYISSVRFAVFFIASIVTAAGGSVFMSKLRQLKWPTFVGFICFLIFYILMSTAKLSSGTAMWGYAVILGIGCGIVLVTIVTAAQLSTPPNLIAITTGLIVAARAVGGAVGLAIYNAIFNSQIATKLPADIAASVLPLGFSPLNLGQLIEAIASQDQAALMKVPGVNLEIIGAAVHGLKEAYLASFKYAWVTAAALCVIAIICSALLIDPKGEMNMHIDAPLDVEDEVKKPVV